MGRKNNQVELLRFIFAVLIMIFHAHNVNNGLGHPIPLGHVFVEFFFFLTGYFTYMHVENKMNLGMISLSDTSYALTYTLQKIKKLIPYMLMTAIPYYFIFSFFKILRLNLNVRDIFREFSGAPFDLLLLQITGICSNPHFNAWWYLSSLLFVLPVVIIVFMKSQFGGGVFMGDVLYSSVDIWLFCIDSWRSRLGDTDLLCKIRGLEGFCRIMYRRRNL